ncbi:exported protein of unknown function [Candidatus Methylomirabilis oxygeniifera]|uniref:Uncharacterized protein n=1 Tax=Methylomirabilis oxygeniifera TaxID=671143 RepID=D5MJR1_METO1|nr:exported protein of unknown function [Candidatus Methylomirabilis oxyfera]
MPLFFDSLLSVFVLPLSAEAAFLSASMAFFRSGLA